MPENRNVWRKDAEAFQRIFKNSQTHTFYKYNHICIVCMYNRFLFFNMFKLILTSNHVLEFCCCYYCF